MGFSAENAKVYETLAPPMLLNATYLADQPTKTGIKEFFKRTSKFGSYAIVEAMINPREVVQVVVDQNAPWIQEAIDSFFGEGVEKLSLDQIRDFLGEFKGRKRKHFDLQRSIGLAPHKALSKSKFLNIFYLDDILNEKDHASLVSSLVAQVLLEKFTNRDSRLVYFQESRGGQLRRDYAVLVSSKKDSGAEILDTQGAFPNVSNLRIQDIRFSHFDAKNEEFVAYEILESDLRLLQPRQKWVEKEKRFSIFAGHGRELDFGVSGRTPTEKRFKREQAQIEQASLDELVPMEIAFHPFWRRLGHTTLRVGESLFELSSKGWRAHNGGTTSARAYLFNNPYFKHQYGLFKHVGMPPISIAVNVNIPKHQALRLRNLMTELSEADGKNREKFSLYTNICNQGIMRVLELSGLPGFSSKGYLGFSSILSFRRLLLHPELPVNARYVYPLPGSEITEANLRKWIPRLLYRHNTSFLEFTRAIPSLGVDALAFGFRRVSDLIFKLIRIRLWQGTEPYFMH